MLHGGNMRARPTVAVAHLLAEDHDGLTVGIPHNLSDQS